MTQTDLHEVDARQLLGVDEHHGRRHGPDRLGVGFDREAGSDPEPILRPVAIRSPVPMPPYPAAKHLCLWVPITKIVVAHQPLS